MTDTTCPACLALPTPSLCEPCQDQIRRDATPAPTWAADYAWAGAMRGLAS